jgi:hypothetical protein
LNGFIGIKVAGGRVKQILNIADRRAKTVHCYTVKNNQETLKIDFYCTFSGKKPEIIGNLALKDLKFLSKGDIAADLVLRMQNRRLHAFVTYKPEGMEQHISVDFKIPSLKNKTEKHNKYLQYGTYITSKGISDSRSLEEQIQQDIEEDLYIEEELSGSRVKDNNVVVEKKKKKLSPLKFVLFFFYGIFAAALILLLVALTFKEVSINELLKMIGINYNLKF